MVLYFKCSGNFTYTETTHSGKIERNRTKANVNKIPVKRFPHSTVTIMLDGTVEWEDNSRQPSNGDTALATQTDSQTHPGR